MRIAKRDQVNPVDRNLVIDDEVANHGIGQLLRSIDTGLTTYSVRVALHFDDVTLLSLKLSRDLVDRVLRLGIQRHLTRTEVNLGIRDRLVLVKASKLSNSTALFWDRSPCVASHLRLVCLRGSYLRLRSWRSLPCSGPGGFRPVRVRIVSP